MELEELAEVYIGVLVNRETKADGQYTYTLFNLKSYEKKQTQQEQIKTNKPFTHLVTKQGDIIFRLISPNKMVLVKDKETENLLIPSQLCIIRPYQSVLLSSFLKWYLESEEGTKILEIHATGTTIQKIGINDLKKIKIPIVSIEKQKEIAELLELWEEEKEIVNLLMEKKEKLYNMIIKEKIG